MSSTDWNERSSRSHTIFQMVILLIIYELLRLYLFQIYNIVNCLLKVIESTAKGSLPSTPNRYYTTGPKMSAASVSLSVLVIIIQL